MDNIIWGFEIALGPNMSLPTDEFIYFNPADKDCPLMTLNDDCLTVRGDCNG